MAGDLAISRIPDRRPMADAAVPIVATPVAFDDHGFAPFRLAGAWKLRSSDARFGGISSLAMDGSAFLALTDSGVAVRFRPPQSGAGRISALIRDLPGGPVSPHFKRYRDSEALIARPGGGWWVAFENRHSLWGYDDRLGVSTGHRSLPGAAWRRNRGVEAMAVIDGALALFPEQGQELLRWETNRWSRYPLVGPGGSPTDAATLPTGQILVALRTIGLGGVRNRLAMLRRGKDGFRLVPVANLPLGRLDNVEAMAIQPLDDGRLRLWLMTDNDFHASRPTLLIALDWREP